MSMPSAEEHITVIHYPFDGKTEKHGSENTSLSNARWGVERVWHLPASPHPSSCKTVKVLNESDEERGAFFFASAFHKASRLTELNADLISMNAVCSGSSNSQCNSARSRSVRIASDVDRRGVKLDWFGRLWLVSRGCNLPKRTCTNTLPGTERSEIGC